MDLDKLLGALDGDETKDVVDLVRKNRGLLEQLGKLPELFASFALATVGAALNKLGDHLAESGGEARGFLHS